MASTQARIFQRIFSCGDLENSKIPYSASPSAENYIYDQPTAAITDHLSVAFFSALRKYFGAILGKF